MSENSWSRVTAVKGRSLAFKIRHGRGIVGLLMYFRCPLGLQIWNCRLEEAILKTSLNLLFLRVEGSFTMLSWTFCLPAGGYCMLWYNKSFFEYCCRIWCYRLRLSPRDCRTDTNNNDVISLAIWREVQLSLPNTGLQQLWNHRPTQPRFAMTSPLGIWRV